MSNRPKPSRDEVLNHLAEVCFGHGNARGSELRALQLMARLRELQQAEDNFGVPAKPFSVGPDNPDAIRVIDQWRQEERRARTERNGVFFKDVARAMKCLEKEEKWARLDADATEGQLIGLTASTALRMIQGRESLPTRQQLIQAVEAQWTISKFLKSPLAPEGSKGIVKAEHLGTAIQAQYRAIQSDTHGTGKRIKWPRILKRLRLFDFLPAR
jgi:hypothetical protein